MSRNRKFVMLALTLSIAFWLSACSGKRVAHDPKRFIREHSLERLPRFEIPVEMNDRVVAWMEYFQGPGRSHFERYLQRSGRYVPLMQEILKREGMPKDLVYIALIESGFNTRARSYASAVGPWQFIQGTGRRYNLRIDGWVDERRDPYKSTQAAAQYFKDLYSEFGDWYLAMAGYNAGEGRVRGAIAMTGSRNFWEMTDDKRAFRAETRDYVPKYIAAAIMAKMPERFGFEGVNYQEPLDFDTGVVETQTDVSVIARCAGASEDDISDLNPHLVRGATPPGARNYEIRIPKGKSAVFAEKYAALPESERIQIVKHEVRKGDTLARIAKRYGVSASAIAAANNLRVSKHRLVRGSTLVIPAGSMAARYASLADDENKGGNSSGTKKSIRHTVKKGESLGKIAGRYGVTSAEIMAWNGIKSAKSVRAGMKLVVKKQERRQVPDDGDVPGSKSFVAARQHRVESGETLVIIARRYGVTPGELMAMNDIGNPRQLKIGMKLVVSRAKAGKSVDDAAEDAPVRVFGTEDAYKKEEPAVEVIKYKVMRGETLGAIAKKHNVPVKDLMAMNNIKNAKAVRDGTSLVIAGSKARTQTGAEVSTPASAPLQSMTRVAEVLESQAAQSPGLSDRIGEDIFKTQAAPQTNELQSVSGTPVKLADIMPKESAIPAAKADIPKSAVLKGSINYEVKNGDTLWDIARRHKVSIAEIQKWNNLKDPSAVRPGTTITIRR